MNLEDDDSAPNAAGKESQKRKIGEVEEPLSISALASDKYGARRPPGDDRPNVLRRVQTEVDSSTGSFTPVEAHHNVIPQGESSRQVTESQDYSCSTWSKYIKLDVSDEGTSQPIVSGGQRVDDPSSHSSTPISCTLHERTSASVSAGGGPTLQAQHFCAVAPQHIVEDATHDLAQEPPQNEQPLAVAEFDESDQGLSAGSLPTALSRIYSIQDCTIRTAATAPLPDSIDPTRPTARFHIEGGSANIPESAGSSEPTSLNDLPRFAPLMANTESSDDAQPSRQSTGQYPIRINYRFASPGLEASLLERMEQRQRMQDADDTDARICGYVISPEDLIWGSVKHYCGMVLDRETRALLGTATLFMPPDHVNIPVERQAGISRPALNPKSAWVTSVKVVEGRTEVLIKNSRGNIHVAQLMLTSTALGLALFSVHMGQGTFALVFLSRVIGPASLPHRLFVDVDRSDRVYIIGYEEPWQSEVGTIADVRVRPGRIIDAGRYAIVEIDFTTGRLGGSITSPAGFRGGLVVRADGLLAGVVTGEVLDNHPSSIDFSPAFNVYSLLEEL